MLWVVQIEGGPKRVNHAAVSINNKIYTFGGYCTGEDLRDYSSIDVHILNTNTFRWVKHPVSDLPFFENDDILPFKRYGHTAVPYGDKIYLWGGRNDRLICSVLFCFDTVWHSWTAPNCTGDIPLARDGHSACVCDNRMYIFGGYEDESDSFAKGVYMLDLEKMRWQYIHTIGTEPQLRDFHTAVCIDHKMYLFGGRCSDSESDVYLPGEKYCPKLWYLDLVTHKWHKPVVYGDNPIGRRSHSAFLRGKKMYIFGGYNAIKSQHYNDIYEFDTTTNYWTKINALGDPPCERRRQASVIIADRVFLFGGTSPFPSASEGSRNNVDKLIDHSDMYVLDFVPTLKTLCLVTTRKYSLNISSLPCNIKNEYKNMVTPNQITVNRPTNSAG